MRLLTTETTLLEGPERLLAIKSSSVGGARDAVNNRSKSNGWATELLTTWTTVLEGPGRLLTTGATIMEVP